MQVPKFNNNNSASSKINLNDYEEVEDEYGFKYMRKKQKLLLSVVAESRSAHHGGDVSVSDDEGEEEEVMSTPVPATKKQVTLMTASSSKPRLNEAFSPSTPTPSKQILENNRKKRRSSFAVAESAANNNSANSTTSSSLRTNLPPDNVKTFEYHRHIETDLPGPVKMRQLMIWACKKASAAAVGGGGSSGFITEKLVNGLINNEITTTWYQRLNSSPSSTETASTAATTPAIYYLPNPQNQELSECIELYKSYHRKLEKECETWESVKYNAANGDIGAKDSSSAKGTSAAKDISADTHTEIDNSLNVLFAEEFQNMNKWLNSLPLSIDRFDWNTKLALSFQDHAKQFCEGVFHQIFAKFFSADLPRAGRNHQRIEPMMLLRALSTNQSITN